MRRHQHKRPAKTAEWKVRRGSRIVAATQDSEREYWIHATKGYRSYRKVSP
jgi:hypothetical protein